jgi:hypothetical protein
VALGAFAVGTRGGSSQDVVPGQAVPPAAPSLFVGIPPHRVLDTRGTDGGPIGVPAAATLKANSTLDVQVAGVGGVPAGATSVAVNITIDDDATLKSFLSVWPTGEPIQSNSASINNAEPGIITQNTALLKLGTGGKITIYNLRGAINVIIDVTGYFVPGVQQPPNRAAAAPGNVFPTDVNITASNAANAAKLTAEGFVAAPTTTWTGTQSIMIGVHEFYWNGTAWAPGNAARFTAAPGSTFAADAQITASNAANAALLIGEGFRANPQTNWTAGQKITIGTFDFNWNGSAWVAGAHA